MAKAQRKNEYGVEGKVSGLHAVPRSCRPDSSLDAEFEARGPLTYCFLGNLRDFERPTDVLLETGVDFTLPLSS